MSTPRPLTVLEKHNKLEAEVNGQLGELNARVSELQASLKNMVEVIAAFFRLQGEGIEDRVEEELQAERQRRADAKREKAKAVLQNLIDTKQFIPSETVVEGCVMVGRELLPSGEPAGAGYAQVSIDQFDDEGRAFLLGKGVGAKRETPGGSFEVTAIYVANPEFGKEPVAEPVAEPVSPNE